MMNAVSSSWGRWCTYGQPIVDGRGWRAIQYGHRAGFRTPPAGSATQFAKPTCDNLRLQINSAAKAAEETYWWWRNPSLTSGPPLLAPVAYTHSHWHIHFVADQRLGGALKAVSALADVSHLAILREMDERVHLLIIDTEIPQRSGKPALSADTLEIIAIYNRDRWGAQIIPTCLWGAFGVWLVSWALETGNPLAWVIPILIMASACTIAMEWPQRIRVPS